MTQSKRDSIAAYITGWSAAFGGGIKCKDCGFVCEDTLTACMAHHAPVIDHAGVKISQCDERRISQDGP